MPEKLKKLIKPLIAAAAVVIVLVVAYFSGSDVSKNGDDSSEIKPSETTTTTVTVTEASTVTSTAAVTTSVSAKDTTAAATKATTTSASKSRTGRTTTSQKETENTTVSETTTASTVSSVTTTVTEPAVTSSVTTSAALPEKQQEQCSFSISCETVFDNKDKIDPAILAEQPSNGIILSERKVGISEGDTVFDVLKKVCDEQGIRIEYSKIAATNNYYIEGINNLYEFDAGNLSGWMYSVNGKFPQLSSSQYTVSDGDVIRFVYSCNIGVDVGDDYFTKAG